MKPKKILFEKEGFLCTVEKLEMLKLTPQVAGISFPAQFRIPGGVYYSWASCIFRSLQCS